jgi:uncharacterized membrane protein YbhN (UPF0104 family)
MVQTVEQISTGEVVFKLSVPWLIASGLFAFASFLVLIEAWVRIITGLTGRRIPFVAAARIWCISNLAIYIPAGPGWQIVQMGVMSAEQGIGGVPAGAAAVINAAINIACGLAVAAITGAPLMARLLGSFAWLGWTTAVVAALCVIALPVLLPTIFRFAARVLHAKVPMESPPARVIAVAAAANVLSWILYGATLQCLSLAVLGVGFGGVLDYTAAFAAAYVVGYLFFLSPGGIGVREATLQKVLVAGALAASAEATELAIASRLLLIVVQVIPALIFLAYRPGRRMPTQEAR